MSRLSTPTTTDHPVPDPETYRYRYVCDTCGAKEYHASCRETVLECDHCYRSRGGQMVFRGERKGGLNG